MPAEWMFIGEAPGREEDRLGRPLVGPSGKLFDRLLDEAKIDRKDAFITNTVKHRPPDNRPPKAAEMKACQGWLEMQIVEVQPRVIVTLGKLAAERVARLETQKAMKVSMAMEHGKGRMRELWGMKVLHVVMYHPAATFRSPELWPLLVVDFRRLRRENGVQLESVEYRLVGPEEGEILMQGIPA